MALAPLKRCSKAGCKTLVRGKSRCAAHTIKRTPTPRTNSKEYQHYYGRQWRKARSAFLAVHPLCKECEQEGKIVAAYVVDHVVPHKGSKELFWDQDNWQGLCETCHNRKSMKGL